MVSNKKVAAPDDVDPVTIGKTRYEVPHWGKSLGLGQNGGHVQAVDTVSGTTLWTAELYKIDYKPNMEPDKQDAFIISLAYDAEHTRLVAQNDRGRRFGLDLFSRQVTPL